MKRINQYLHEYDFPYHDYFSKFKDELIGNYNLLKKQGWQSNDVGMDPKHELNKVLLPKIEHIIKDNYVTSSQLEFPPLRYYVQNNNTNNEKNGFSYHNHSHLIGNINVVFYLNLPVKGGELGYFISPSSWMKIKPKENKIYMMPHWLYHTALPQEDEDIRISFNWNYPGSNRAVHKITGDIW